MDFTQIIAQLQSDGNDLQKPFDGLRTRLRAIGVAILAYECARNTNRRDLFSDRVAAIKKEFDAIDWPFLGKIEELLPRKSNSRFKAFRQSFSDSMTRIGEISANLDFVPTDNIIIELRRLSADLDEFELEGARASKRKRWIVAGCSVAILVGGPMFLFAQYWLGGIEPDSFTLLFPADASGQHAVVSAHRHDFRSSRFEVPDRNAFMTDFTRFYFGHRNNFLDQNYEVLPPRKKPSDVSFRPPEAGPDATFTAPAPTPPGEHAPSPNPTQVNEAIGSAGATADSVNKKQVVVGAWQTQQERAYRWKLLLQNTSLRSPRYVSSVRETVELVEEVPFPWAELRYRPELKIRCAKPDTYFASTSPPVIEISNTGLGPAVDLTVKVNTLQGEQIRSASQFHFGGQRVGSIDILDDEKCGFVYLRKTSTNGSTEWVLDDATPAYMKLARLPDGTKDEDIEIEKSPSFPCSPYERIHRPFVRTEGQLLKKIRTRDELTGVVESIGRKLVTTITYEDLKGDKRQIAHEIAIPDNILIFKWNDKLFRPRKGLSPAGASALWLSLANAYQPLPLNKADRDALMVIHDFDLSNIGRGGKVMGETQFDVNLSALGHIAIYTTARCIRSGTYQVSVHVNEAEKIKLRLDVLNPELRQFPSPRSNKHGLQAVDANSLRISRRAEIHWYRQKLGLDDESYEVTQLPKDDFRLLLLDNQDNPGLIWGEAENPFDPANPQLMSTPPSPPSAVGAASTTAPAPPVESAPRRPQERPFRKANGAVSAIEDIRNLPNPGIKEAPQPEQ